MEHRKTISVFGLGYVGCVCVGGFAALGHTVIGVDVAKEKVDQLSRGVPTVVEPGLADLIRSGHAAHSITATTDVEEAVSNSDIALICVGTPSSGNGHLDLGHVYSVAEDIGRSLRRRRGFFTVVIRSTVLPGTNERIRTLLENASEKKEGVDFGVVSNPEFLREGSAIRDFLEPELTVVAGSSDRAIREVREMYGENGAAVRRVEARVAEVIKYVNNSFHALKVTFANEVGRICKAAGIDAFSVMKLMCEDTRLNISPAYLMPGPPFGGSCLPKDLKGLVTLAHDHYVEVPVISSIDRSNRVHKDSVLDVVLRTGKRRVGFLGLSFKAGTDDLRSSPSVELAEQLIGKGLWVLIYDNNVRAARLTGANKSEIERRIPKMQSYMTESLTDLVERTDVVVLSQTETGLEELIRQNPDKSFIDLARVDHDGNGNCVGIVW